MRITSLIAHKRKKSYLLLGSADYTGSTLTSSVFALTANGSATTTLEATVYRDGVLSAGEVVTYTVQRIQMDAADSFVSANPTDIDSDGVATSTITVSASYNLNGDYIALPGIPAASVVVAVSGTNNTITQPASATDATGVATASFVSTQASATKTVSATIIGLAVTDTATVTTDAAAPVPPTGSDPDYTMPTTVGNVRSTVAGVTWETGDADVTEQVVPAGRSGYGLRFRFGPDASGEDSSAEQRFALPTDITEIWIEDYIYVPSNYTHRNDTGSDNNKFERLWGDAYASANKVGCSMYVGSGDGGSVLRYEYNYKAWADGTLGVGPDGKTGGQPAFPTIAQQGTWVQVRRHYKMVSATDADDGEYRLWIDGTLVDEFTGIQQKYDTAKPYWNAGYAFGWANSGYLAETDFYLHERKMWWTNNPGWV